MTADFWDFCMKLSCMNTHRVGQNSLEPYRSSESSPKQSKNADMDQTGYAIDPNFFSETETHFFKFSHTFLLLRVFRNLKLNIYL